MFLKGFYGRMAALAEGYIITNLNKYIIEFITILLFRYGKLIII
jgi:hypothetical protein